MLGERFGLEHSTLQVEHAPGPGPARAVVPPPRAAAPIDSAPCRRSPSKARPRSSPAPPAASARRPPRRCATQGVKVAVGARRVDRLEGDFAHELDVTDPGSAERFVEAAVEALGGARHPRQQRRRRDRPLPVLGVERGGRGVDDRGERPRPDADDAPLPARTSATAGTSSTWTRSPAGRRTRTRPSTARSRRPSAMFSQALREDLLGRPIRDHRRWRRAWPAEPSSRSSASRATRRRRRPSTRASSR